MSKRIRSQKIRSKFTKVSEYVKNGNATITDIKLTGWLEKDYAWIRVADQDNNYLAILQGAELYRLAKAIVRRFEADV
jgi:NRPS condensation-like uncharacterized protein